MIKINLIDSVTERQKGVTTTVEKKVTSSTSKVFLIAVAVFSLLALGIGWDYYSSSSAKARAEKELLAQKELEKQLQAIIKEQNDLQQKIKDVEVRIEAIKNLRSSQAGPSAVLRSLKERIDSVAGLYLESVEQKGDQLVIKGNSPNEYTVTQFGRSLEFSNGLFSNLNIETQRKDMELVDEKGQTVSLGGDGKMPKPETVAFTIRCAYSPSNSGGLQNQNGSASSGNKPTAGTQTAGNQVAQK
jgi:Tfp pilus assembly protein PilN